MSIESTKTAAGGVTPARWQLALRAHRSAHSNNPARDHAGLMFAACSESVATAELVAAFPTAYVLQTLGSLPRVLDAATRATIELGVLGTGVRQIVVCGHRCNASEGALTSETSQARVVARCRALQADDDIGPMLRRARVTMRALWLDDDSRDLYACDFEGRPARRMDDEDLAGMFARFDEVPA